MADWVDQGGGGGKETNTKLTHNVIHLDTNNDMDKNVFFFVFFFHKEIRELMREELDKFDSHII